MGAPNDFLSPCQGPGPAQGDLKVGPNNFPESQHRVETC